MPTPPTPWLEAWRQQARRLLRSVPRALRRNDWADRQGQLFDVPIEGPSVAPVEGPVKAPSNPRAQVPSPKAPEVFTHRRATHQTRLAGQMVAYSLTRARRRSIGMTIGAEGLSVRAPRWVSMGDIQAALDERAQWIVQHLRSERDRQARAEATRIVWRHGAHVQYLGAPLQIVLDEHVTGVVLDVPATLRVGLRQDAAEQAVRDAVHAWLQRQAKALFQTRCDHFARELGVTVTKLALSAAKTRWGSAGADGSVRLNWRLIHYPLDCIDYVVAHELAHLRHMNHSPAFWRVVASVLPQYQVAQAVLKEEAHALRD